MHRVLPLALLPLLFSTTALRAANDVWHVSAERFRCVMTNVETYLESGQKILMIVVDACPETDPTEALKKISKNSAVPSLPVRESSDQVLDSIVVFTPDELECLAGLQIDLTGEVAELPRKPACP